MPENYQNKEHTGWKKLISDFNKINKGEHFPLPAYSEIHAISKIRMQSLR